MGHAVNDMTRLRALPTSCLLAALVLLLTACAGPQPTSSPEVVAAVLDRLPTAPDDRAWDDVPFHTAELLLQDMVEPRLLEPSVPRADVRAITDGVRIAVKLSWVDATHDDLPGAARFSDACALQFPVDDSPDVPAPQMGEEGRRVEIAYWRASWQASLDGRPDTIQAAYPGATVDHYPFEAASLEEGSAERRELERQYAPARALGNPMEGPRDRSVQDLIAEGPGTLTPAASQRSEGYASRSPEGLGGHRRTQVAVAIWDGNRDEVGARKMRSGWIPLRLEEEETE
jgi:hypothetical protein